MRTGVWVVGTIILGVGILGCSGAGGPASAGAQTPGATGAEPTQGGSVPTSAPVGSDAPTVEPTQGGGPSLGVCELVTADELATIVGKPVVLAVLAGPPDTCDVQSNDAPIAAFVFMRGPEFAFAFDAWASDPSAEDVPGIGDGTVYVADSQLVIVKRGDALFSVSVYDVDVAISGRLEMMKEIARIAAARM